MPRTGAAQRCRREALQCGFPRAALHDKKISAPLLAVTLAGLAMLGPFSIDTFLPSFPAIQREFAVGTVEMQQTLSVYLATFAVMTLFHGALSYSFGRRPVILACL